MSCMFTLFILFSSVNKKNIQIIIKTIQYRQRMVLHNEIFLALGEAVTRYKLHVLKQWFMGPRFCSTALILLTFAQMLAQIITLNYFYTYPVLNKCFLMSFFLKRSRYMFAL